MRTNPLRYIICALVCIVGTTLYAQEKFDEHLAATSNMTPYQALYHLEQYQKQYPWFSGVYYHLGIASEKLIPNIHPILNYEHLKRILYNARVYYGNCMHYANGYPLKNEEFEGLPLKGKRVEYEDVARFSRKKLNHVKQVQTLVDELYNSYSRMVKRYGECRQVFTKFCEIYPGEKQAHLRLKDQDIALLQSLEEQFEALNEDIKAFEEALKNYPIEHYKPAFSFSDIQLYRLDGLTHTNFMESNIVLWNYGEFAKQFLQKQDNEYGEYYKAIQQDFQQVENAARQMRAGKKQTVKTNRILTNYINKMDYESFMVPLTYIQQKCGDMLQCHAQGLFADADTVDGETIELALSNLYEKYQRMDTCQTMYTLLQQRLSSSELEKYKSVLGQDTTTQAVLSLAKGRISLADTVYGEISKQFYDAIDETLTKFEKYTDPLTDLVIYAHQLPQREAELVTVLPMANHYLVVYEDGYMATVNAQLEVIHQSEYMQDLPIRAAYKVAGNVIALVTPTRIGYLVSD